MGKGDVSPGSSPNAPVRYSRVSGPGKDVGSMLFGHTDHDRIHPHPGSKVLQPPYPLFSLKDIAEHNTQDNGWV